MDLGQSVPFGKIFTPPRPRYLKRKEAAKGLKNDKQKLSAGENNDKE
jgi:hypothetical protein